MDLNVRTATVQDQQALAALSSECFGSPRTGPLRDPNADGRRTEVVTDQDRVVGCVAVRDYDSWFWGAVVPTAGVASVKVASEHRRHGLLTPLMQAALTRAHATGAAISTLYPTAPGIYRRFGYETFAEYAETTAFPTSDLAHVAPRAATLRRAQVTDLAAVRRTYTRWAREHNGPLTRQGASFTSTDEEVLASFDGITLAEEDGDVTGYAMWNRTGGYDDEGRLEVADLVALTPDAAAGLLSTLGSHATVAPTTLLSTSLPDPALSLLPTYRPRVRASLPYGLAILDVESAFGSARPAPFLSADLQFRVEGLPLTEQDGGYRLSVENGSVRVQRIDLATGEDTVQFRARGLALRYSGAAANVDLRRAGLLAGPDTDDAKWDAVFGGRRVHIRDYF